MAPPTRCRSAMGFRSRREQPRPRPSFLAPVAKAWGISRFQQTGPPRIWPWPRQFKEGDLLGICRGCGRIATMSRTHASPNKTTPIHLLVNLNALMTKYLLGIDIGTGGTRA